MGNVIGKKYKASYTVEATVVMVIVMVAVLYTIICAMYVSDAVIMKSVSVIEAIDASEQKYYFKHRKTGLLSKSYKLNRGLFETGSIGEVLLEEKMTNGLIMSKLKDFNIEEGALNLTLKIRGQFVQSKYFGDIYQETKVANKDQVEFLRLVHALAKEVFD